MIDRYGLCNDVSLSNRASYKLVHGVISLSCKTFACPCLDTRSLKMEPLPSSSQRVNEEPLSIYELARRQPTKRILVEPLLWTRLHLETLSCTFSQCSPVPLAVMDIPWTEKPHVVAYIFQDFEKCFFGDRNSWTAKEASIRSFLSFEPSPLSWQ